MKLKLNGHVELRINSNVVLKEKNNINPTGAVTIVVAGLIDNLPNNKIDNVLIFDDFDNLLTPGYHYSLDMFSATSVIPGTILVEASLIAISDFKLGKLSLENTSSTTVIANKIVSPFVNITAGQVLEIAWTIEISIS
jgi:hypothetical protein